MRNVIVLGLSLELRNRPTLEIDQAVFSDAAQENSFAKRIAAKVIAEQAPSTEVYLPPLSFSSSLHTQIEFTPRGNEGDVIFPIAATCVVAVNNDCELRYALIFNLRDAAEAEELSAYNFPYIIENAAAKRMRILTITELQQLDDIKIVGNNYNARRVNQVLQNGKVQTQAPEFDGASEPVLLELAQIEEQPQLGQLISNAVEAHITEALATEVPLTAEEAANPTETLRAIHTKLAQVILAAAKAYKPATFPKSKFNERFGCYVTYADNGQHRLKQNDITRVSIHELADFLTSKDEDSRKDLGFGAQNHHAVYLKIKAELQVQDKRTNATRVYLLTLRHKATRLGGLLLQQKAVQAEVHVRAQLATYMQETFNPAVPNTDHFVTSQPEDRFKPTVTEVKDAFVAILLERLDDSQKALVDTRKVKEAVAARVGRSLLSQTGKRRRAATITITRAKLSEAVQTYQSTSIFACCKKASSAVMKKLQVECEKEGEGENYTRKQVADLFKPTGVCLFIDAKRAKARAAALEGGNAIQGSTYGTDAVINELIGIFNTK